MHSLSDTHGFSGSQGLLVMMLYFFSSASTGSTFFSVLALSACASVVSQTFALSDF